MRGTTSPSQSSTPRRRNPTGACCRPRPRRRPGRCPSRVPARAVAERIERNCKTRAAKQRDRHTKRSFNELRRATLEVLDRQEIERLARECGFTQREPKEIKAFEFAVCSALAAVVEGKRSFAAIWRLMIAAAGVKVARSAVTQRIGSGSAELMRKLVELVAQRVKKVDCPELMARLDGFKAVLANDGSVIKLSPLLQKLFPSRRTDGAAARLHGTVDLVNRQVVGVEVIGDRESELAVARSIPIEENTLYMNDLGYVDYTYWGAIKDGGGELLSRLKRNANPTVVGVRHGVRAPVRTVREGYGLNHSNFSLLKKAETFDLDARFKTKNGSVELRVVGVFDAEIDAFRMYVTTLPAEEYSPYDIADLYRLRWVIELLFKLLKSSCHLDHVDTSNPDGLRTHIYSSVLASLLLSELCHDVARDAGIHPSKLSVLTVGHAAPLIVLPLLFLLFEREVTHEALWDCITNVLVIGCRDQNPNRTKDYWKGLSNS